MVIGTLFGLHMLLLLAWRHCVNSRYCAWRLRGRTRVVLVNKRKGDGLGVGLAGLVVQTVDDGSPCAKVLSPGDWILLVNRSRPWSDRHASRLIRNASELYLLVSSPPAASSPDHEHTPSAPEAPSPAPAAVRPPEPVPAPAAPETKEAGRRGGGWSPWPSWPSSLRLSGFYFTGACTVRVAPKPSRAQVAPEAEGSSKPQPTGSLLAPSSAAAAAARGARQRISFETEAAAPSIAPNVPPLQLGADGMWQASSTAQDRAVFIQAVWRRHHTIYRVVPEVLAEKRYAKLTVEFATKLQALVRRKQCTTYIQDHKAAQRLQRAWRRRRLLLIWRSTGSASVGGQGTLSPPPSPPTSHPPAADVAMVEQTTTASLEAGLNDADDHEMSGLLLRLPAGGKDHVPPLARDTWAPIVSSVTTAKKKNKTPKYVSISAAAPAEALKLDTASAPSHCPAAVPEAGAPATSHKLKAPPAEILEATAVSLPMHKLPTMSMRKLYSKVAKAKTLQPAFRSLPEAFFWPNLEVSHARGGTAASNAAVTH